MTCWRRADAGGAGAQREAVRQLRPPCAGHKGVRETEEMVKSTSKLAEERGYERLDQAKSISGGRQRHITCSL
jgi:hypothetical protein